MAQRVTKYDSSITDITRADEIAQRKELLTSSHNLKKIEATEKDRNVREDLEILQKTYSLQFRADDYRLDHNVPYLDPAAAVFAGLSTLLNDQVPEGRRSAALIRLRKYAGVEPGFTPFTDVPEAAHDGADGQAGRGLSLGRRDGVPTRTKQLLRQQHADVVR